MTTPMIFDFVAIKAAMEEKRKSEPETPGAGWTFLPEENRWLYSGEGNEVAYSPIRQRLLGEWAACVSVGTLNLGHLPAWAQSPLQTYIAKPPEALSGENAD